MWRQKGGPDISSGVLEGVYVFVSVCICLFTLMSVPCDLFVFEAYTLTLHAYNIHIKYCILFSSHPGVRII